MNDLKKLIDITIESKLKNTMPANISYATLVSLDPLNFKLDSNPDLDIKEEFLVVPKYRVFTVKDVGKKFVLISNDGGQTYFYLYESSDPQGSNGVPYHFEGTFKGTLHGTCPDGEVVVTHGEITDLEHKGGV